MSGFFGSRLRGHGTTPLRISQQTKRVKTARKLLQELGAITEFELRHVFHIDERGMIAFRRYKPVLHRGSIIGYHSYFSGLFVMRDRNGTRVFSAERGIEPSLISPVDIFGPAIIVGVARGFVASISSVALQGGARGAARAVGGAFAKALQKMVSAARSLSTTRVSVEIGAGDLKAAILAATKGLVKKRVIAIEMDLSMYTKSAAASLKRAGGQLFRSTNEVVGGIADDVAQYFPYDIALGGEGMALHAPHLIVKEALRIARPGATIRFVIAQNTRLCKETIEFLTKEAMRLGAKGISLTTSTAAKAAPGASAAGVPRVAGQMTLETMKVFVLKFKKVK